MTMNKDNFLESFKKSSNICLVDEKDITFHLFLRKKKSMLTNGPVVKLVSRRLRKAELP